MERSTFTKVYLDKDGFSGIFNVLSDIGVISIDRDGDMHGKRGVSRNPKWDGSWEGYYWSDSSIELTQKGMNLLRDNRIHFE